MSPLKLTELNWNKLRLFYLMALPFDHEDQEIALYDSDPTDYQNFRHITLSGDFLKTSFEEKNSVKVMRSRSSPEIRGINRRPPLVS